MKVIEGPVGWLKGHIPACLAAETKAVGVQYRTFHLVLRTFPAPRTALHFQLVDALGVRLVSSLYLNLVATSTLV